MKTYNGHGPAHERDKDMLTYGDITRDPTKLPEVSLAALLSRGFSHYLGNEQASKVNSRIKSQIAGPEGKAKDVTTEQVKAFRKSAEADENSFEAKFLEKVEAETEQAALAALDAGTVGAHVARGPRVSPVENVMRRLAKEEVVLVLAKVGVKFPKKDETVTLGNATRTGDELIANWLSGSDKKGLFSPAGSDNEPRLRKAAEREIAAKVKKAEAVAKSESGDAADLGL